MSVEDKVKILSDSAWRHRSMSDDSGVSLTAGPERVQPTPDSELTAEVISSWSDGARRCV